MNPLVKEQLEKVHITMPSYDESSTEIVIPKNSGLPQVDFQLNHYYTIKVDDSLINKGPWYDTIHNNWNNGRAPLYNVLNVEVCQFVGKMLKVEATAPGTTYTWSGWLPRNNCKIIEEIL